jgi:hypothetical protein
LLVLLACAAGKKTEKSSTLNQDEIIKRLESEEFKKIARQFI